MEQVFSYGTLQNKNVQMDLFGRVLKGTNDSLVGYKIETIEITDTSFLSKGEEKRQRTLIPSENKKDKITGTVFELTNAELLLADKYEPDNYKRFKVKLGSGKEAWIYRAALWTRH